MGGTLMFVSAPGRHGRHGLEASDHQRFGEPSPPECFGGAEWLGQDEDRLTWIFLGGDMRRLS